MRNFILLIGFFLLSITLAQAQRTIKGTIIDPNGEPVIGASVMVVGTTVGTVSDFNGAYELVVPQGSSTIQFAYTGYQTQTANLGASNIVDITLVEGVVLETAVVTALGISRDKKELGYAIEKVDGEDIQLKGENDVLRALQGKVAGVNIIGSSSQPGSATRLTIRGNTSFLGDNQALYVVDGIPFDGSSYGASFQLTGGGAYGNRMADLDPNNIENITILKGATAAALYGSRASRGVVIITTKSGSNKKRDGLHIEISSGMTGESITSIPNLQNKYGTGTGFSYSGANGSWGAAFPGAVDYPTIDSINHWFRATAPASYARLRELGTPGVTPRVVYQAYPDNVKSLFHNGTMLDNSVTLSTSLGNNGAFVATVSQLNHDGIIPNSSYDKTSVSVGGNNEFAGGFKIGANISYTSSLQKGLQGGAIASAQTSSYMARSLYLGRSWDIAGQPYEDPVTHESIFFVGRGSADNPKWSSKYNGFNSDVSRTIVNLNAGYAIDKLFDIDYRIGLNTYDQNDLEWYRPGSRGANGLGQVISGYNQFEEIESILMLSKRVRFNDNFAIQARVGHNINQRTVNSQNIVGSQMLDFNILDIDNTISQVTGGGNYNRQRLIGVFGELTFDVKSYLFLTLTGRNDWSSTLPVANRSFFYPSASLAFVFTEALGMSPTGFLSSGKLRVNWAKVGHSPDPYSIDPIYFVNLGEPDNLTAGVRDIDFPFNGHAGLTLENTLKDPNLKPEFTTNKELGLELSFLNNRVTLDAAVYETVSTDQLAPLTLPTASGYDAFYTNFGNLRSRGAEITLGLTPVRSKDFQWNISGAFTKYKTTVEELFGDVNEIEIRALFGGSITPVLRVGEEYGVFRGTVSARDNEGNLLIDPSNGTVLNANHEEIIGNPNPDFTLGIVNSFTWKGFSLGAVLDWKQGGDLYSESVNEELGRGVLAFQADHRELGAVIPGVYGNAVTLQPILDENGNKIKNQTLVEQNDLWFGSSFGANAQDEWLVFDATVIRLREISLGYTISSKTLGHSPIKGITISLVGRNLWYKAPNFPKDAHFDPETNTFGDANFQGFEFQNLPSIRRFGANVKLTF
ncbi:MAG: SusC/RagA family TonB-linked outer membrane protein [Saprospiraceae bacterium]|uniref:SusC/RagA family TonB-linked outer membrane protein n=1 Tax=Candidatus Opimibacter skivensis TaxID=2982028 RepID=A0A9D7T145_9BACT|nr:SusC/RagA family TonB-linked outer membrane protein [Candidatus Opimibacter skivensis]